MMLDKMLNAKQLTSLESTTRANLKLSGVNYCKSYLDIIYYASECYLHVKHICPGYWTLFWAADACARVHETALF